MIVISDTSVLSALSETGLTVLLPELFGEVMVTQTVLRECSAPGSPEELRQLVNDHPPWFVVVPDPDFILPETGVLDPGEASSISLAWQRRQDSLLIIDEKRGRKVAQALGLKITGVLAIVVEAARRELIDFDRSVTLLRKANFRLAPSLIEEARRMLA